MFEAQTIKGSRDAYIELEDMVYIFEFKYDKPATETLDQIRKMGYFEKYKGTNKDIMLIGVGFNRKEKFIDYECMPLSP